MDHGLGPHDCLRLCRRNDPSLHAADQPESRHHHPRDLIHDVELRPHPGPHHLRHLHLASDLVQTPSRRAASRRLPSLGRSR